MPQEKLSVQKRREQKSGVMSGRELLKWETPSFKKYQRSLWWYIIAVGVGAALLIYAIATFNFLFAVIVVMAAVILALNTLREPVETPVVLTNVGISYGGRLYHYEDMRAFWICYEPPQVTELYIDFKGVRPRLSLSLEKMNPSAVRDILRKYIKEDLTRRDEPLSDLIGRILRI